jgi:hypothetical protein
MDSGNLDTLTKALDLSSRLGATGMTIWGSPDQKAQGRKILGTPPPSTPTPPTTQLPSTQLAAPPAYPNLGLSGLSGIGANQGNPPAGTGGTSLLLPAPVPGANPPGGRTTPLA